MVGGALAGGITAALVAILPLVMSFVNLRFIFIAFDKPLYDMLTFSLSRCSGSRASLPSGSRLAFSGVLMVALPPSIRRPITAGIVAAGLAGLFQELIRPILANSSVSSRCTICSIPIRGSSSRAPSSSSASRRAGLLIRDLTAERAEASLNRLPPATRRMSEGRAGGRLVILAALFPLYAGNFVGQVLLTVGLFILMGMGLNLEVGIAGLLDLGFVAFYAVGAYTTALLTADSPFALAQLSYWEAMPIAVFAR